MFKKRKRPPASIVVPGADATHSGTPPLGYSIEFDMMLKGNVYERPGGKVRQYGVTVNGGTKLVTSGNIVDRATYEALIVAGAIRSDPGVSPEQEATAPTLVDEDPEPRVELPPAEDNEE